MAMTNQGARQAAYRAIAGTAGTYNEDAMAAYLALGGTGTTFNEVEFSHLADVAGYADTDPTITISGLRAEYAGLLGYDSWNSLDTIDS
jgi:hypothetical protein